MAKRVIYIGQDDEISDVISKVRQVDEGEEVALVLPGNAHVFQTPLNVRLLNQFTAKQSRPTAIVSDDPRIQQMARGSGFATYASVVAYERGVEVVEPHAGDEGPMLRAGGVAVAPAPPAVAAVARVAAPRQVTMPAPAPPSSGKPPPPHAIVQPRAGRDRRRPLYFALIGIGIIGLILFVVLSPSAKITVTINAVPLTAKTTIHGTTDPAAVQQKDSVPTLVVSDSSNQQFTATPTGQKALPATAATGAVQMKVDPSNLTCQLQPGCQLAVKKGTSFLTSDATPIVFVSTQDTTVTFPAPGVWSNTVPVQASAGGANTNVPVGAINKFADPAYANQGITVTNAAATAGGADPKNVVVAQDPDIQSWNAQVKAAEQQLTDKVNGDMAAKAPGKIFAVDPNGGGRSIAFTVTPALPNSGDQFAATPVTVTVNAKATAYDPNDIKRVLTADLQQQVQAGWILSTDKLNIAPVSIVSATDSGEVSIYATASDYQHADVNLDDLKSNLTGKGPSEVTSIIKHRIDQVQRVDIEERPLSLFFMPFFSSRIEIIQNYVTVAAAAPPGA